MQACPRCRATYADDVSTCPDDGTTLLPSGLLAAVDAPLEPGTMVGEYRVDGKLGAGTFGDVYAGEQPVIGKRVAIKVLHRKFSSDPEVVSRFVAEARAVNRIRHRHIIDIFSFGMIGDSRHYFVMELLDGLTLGELLEQERRLPLDRALPIFRGIASGLDAAHEAGITHRDLKPDNVFLAVEKDGSYFAKLLDFGVAKLAGEDVAHRTATGMAIGTPRYMSPEQCRGKKVDHRADIYSLGALIHEVLTGRPLFEGDSTMDVFFKHTTELPPPMSSICADLPPELDAPVLAMLAKRPKDRPESAGAAVSDLIERARAAGRTSTLPVSTGAARSVVRSESAETVERLPLDAATVAVRRRGPRAEAAPPASSPSAADVPTVEMSVVDSTADPGAPGGRSVTFSEPQAAAAGSSPSEDRAEDSATAARGATQIAPVSKVSGTLLADETGPHGAPSGGTLRSPAVETDAPVTHSAPAAARPRTSPLAWIAGALVVAGIAAALAAKLLPGDPAPPPGTAPAAATTAPPAASSALLPGTSAAVTAEPTSTAAATAQPSGAPTLEASATSLEAPASTSAAGPKAGGKTAASSRPARTPVSGAPDGKPIATQDIHHDIEPPPLVAPPK